MLSLRKGWAAIYCDDETLFGPIKTPGWPETISQLSQEDQGTV